MRSPQPGVHLRNRCGDAEIEHHRSQGSPQSVYAGSGPILRRCGDAEMFQPSKEAPGGGAARHPTQTRARYADPMLKHRGAVRVARERVRPRLPARTPGPNHDPRRVRTSPTTPGRDRCRRRPENAAPRADAIRTTRTAVTEPRCGFGVTRVYGHPDQRRHRTRAEQQSPRHHTPLPALRTGETHPSQRDRD